MKLLKNIAKFILLKYYKLTGKKFIVINAASGLGDYIYARTYLELLRKKYNNYKIILLGTKRWKDFAIFHDKKYVDMFYFFKNPFKPIFKEYFGLNFLNFDIFINIQPAKEWNDINSFINADSIYEINMKKYSSTYQERTYELFSKIVNIPKDFQYKFRMPQSAVISSECPPPPNFGNYIKKYRKLRSYRTWRLCTRTIF